MANINRNWSEFHVSPEWTVGWDTRTAEQGTVKDGGCISTTVSCNNTTLSAKMGASKAKRRSDVFLLAGI